MTTSANRVTPEAIEANIQSEHYFSAEDAVATSNGASPNEYASLRLLTFCILILRNGFTVTGQSACVDSANFDKEIGERIARTDAFNKVWPLMGYAMKEELAQNV